MGGSGGTYVPSPSPQRVEALLRRSNNDSDEAAYEAKVNGLLEDALEEFNRRDVAAIRRHVGAVRKALEAEGDGTIELTFGGSVRKHTYVDGFSDVDVLAILNKSERAGRSPLAVLDEFAQRLRTRFPNTEIVTGKLAITIRYSDGVELQVLPALATTSGLRIARSIGEGWSNVVRPTGFAQKLTSVNRAQGGKVVPTIKLFKAVIEATRPDDMKLSGYHAESLAIESFERYTGRLATKTMLHHLCRTAADLVKAPINDRTGQSLHVDDYLGSTNSRARRQLAAHLGQLAKELESADRAQDLSTWKTILGDE